MNLFHGKPVYWMIHNAAIEDEAVLKNIWGDHYSYWTRKASSYFIETEAEIQNKIKAARTTLGANGVLFFAKNSDFPRFKLADTPYKRCIKIEKADYVVTNTYNIHTYNADILILEDEEYAYFIQEGSIIRCQDSVKRTQFTTDPFKYIQDHNLFYGTTINKVYKGKLSYVDSSDIAEDITNILNGTYTNLIMDSELDMAVNKNFDILTKEDISAIEDMLDSPDSATRELGLKMLFGYNVQETPLTVRTMLGLRENKLSSLNAFKGVGVQQVLDSINWGGFGRLPNDMYRIVTPNGKPSVLSKTDRELCINTYTRALRTYFDAQLENFTRSGILSTLGLSISVGINNVDSNSGTEE